ncbi:MAG: threonine/serine exporter family protein [Firmicutes bacterium]|nr:threonine/serine exporter family protein [Bacillota bacterium]
MTSIIIQGLAAAGGTAGFCLIFRVPLREIPICGVIGAMGWMLYNVVLIGGQDNKVFATFLAAALVGLLSEISARIFKEPTTLFTVPGVLPLVPGFHIFKAMEAVMNNNMDSSESWVTMTFKLAVAIALGLLAIGAVFNVIQSIYHKTVSATEGVIEQLKRPPN